MQNDFSKGNVSKIMFRLAVPIIIAQLVNILYSVVDRIYIGHMEGIGQLALTGIGLCFPITMTVSAFSALIGTGGAPLSSILRGAKNMKGAQKVLGNSVTALVTLGILVPAACLLLKEQVLYLFGASDATYGYANTYITIYLCGSLPVMLTLGLNPFINAQGYTRFGMVTVAIGALCNLILDPVFIFAFGMGIAGAAVATVISQCVSCVWVLVFLLGKRNLIPLKREHMKPDPAVLGRICGLGVSGFIMQITESALSAVFNANLQRFGGDIYVTTMTVGASISQFAYVFTTGFSQGAQPVAGYNFGAGEYGRVRSCFKVLLRFNLISVCVIWIIIHAFLPQLISIFNSDPVLIEVAVPLLHIYFACLLVFAFQISCQNLFVALGEAKKSVTFALLRKIVLLIPLIFLLPRLGFGVPGIFAAEPVATTISAVVCFITFLCTTYRSLKEKERAGESALK